MEPNKVIQIWERCKSQDRQAQSELYQYFSAKMYALCIRYAKDQDDAADILQNGFIKVFKKCELFEGKGSLEGWIRKVMVNTAIESHRKNKVRFLSTEELTGHEIEQAGSFSLTHLDYKDLLALIKKLPMGYRTVFNLYAIEGYNHKEIAEMLEISEGSSKSQLSRARSWLKERIQKMEELGI
ncbi:RNA polymerase [Sphingobacterium cellulitidis]|uniref:RNA polymerase sigma factor n=2 Tax=Sphingobacterium TaxID=28453 RepID=UPI000B9410C7|nr:MULTISPECIES: RNA polymerase sigma factor [Sphingobacterium]OYD46338.1 RNA polymerase [Sphingobacterium cellulitidis]WFB63095.1 RNA polymerase sigma factor [Sphingobacterium sp. WM]